MTWHCVVKGSENNICDGTPEWGKEPETAGVGFVYGGTCKLIPDTCGRCRAPRVPPIDPEKKSSYIHKFIPAPSKEKEKEKTTSKSKSAKKLEQEMAQKRLF